MPPLIAVLSALAVAGGLGALIGILVGGRSQHQAVAPNAGQRSADVPTAQQAPRIKKLSELAPKGYIGMLERQLLLAGRPPAWTIDKILIAKVMLLVASGLFTVWWVGLDPSIVRIVIASAVILLAFFTPDLLIYSRGQERQQAIQNALPDTLDQMTISVEAGLGFEAAMLKAGNNGRGPLADELIRTLQDMSIGRSRIDAYHGLAERTTSVDLRRFTRSVIQADLYGIAIAEVLRVQAAEVRMRRRQRAEEQAMKVPVKVIFPLIFCILPVLFIVLMTPAVLSMVDAFS